MVGKSAVTGALVSGAVLAAPAAAETSQRQLTAISWSADITAATVDLTFASLPDAHPDLQIATLGDNNLTAGVPLENAIYNVLSTLLPGLSGFEVADVQITNGAALTAQNGYNATVPFTLKLSSGSVSNGDAAGLEIIRKHVMPTTHGSSAGEDVERAEFSRLVMAAYEGLSTQTDGVRFDWAPVDLAQGNEDLEGEVTLTFDTWPDDAAFGFSDSTESQFDNTNNEGTNGVPKYETLTGLLKSQLPKSKAFKALGLDAATGFVLRGDNPVQSARGNAVTFNVKVAFGSDAFDANNALSNREKVNTMWRAISGLEGHAVEGQEFGQEIACHLQAALTEATNTDFRVKVPSEATCNAIREIAAGGNSDPDTDGNSTEDDSSDEASSARSVAVVSFLSTAAAAAALF